MKRDYYCPSCQTTLNPGERIILAARNGARQGLVLLSPQPGNYEAISSATLALHEGDRVTFFCPACHASLHAEADGKLAELAYREGTETGRVNFSRCYGEHATYFVRGDEVRAYGDDAEAYDNCNFFGEGALR